MPPAACRPLQRRCLDDVVAVGLGNTPQGISKALARLLNGRCIGIRGTVGKTSADSQLRQYEIELHGIQVVEALAVLAVGGDVATVGIRLHGIVPGSHIDGLAVLVVIDSLDDGLGHQARHIVEGSGRGLRRCKLVALTVVSAEAGNLGVGLEVVDAGVDDQLGIAYALNKRTRLASICGNAVGSIHHACAGKCHPHQHFSHIILLLLFIQQALAQSLWDSTSSPADVLSR